MEFSVAGQPIKRVTSSAAEKIFWRQRGPRVDYERPPCRNRRRSIIERGHEHRDAAPIRKPGRFTYSLTVQSPPGLRRW